MKRFGGAILNFLYNEIVTHIPLHILRKAFLRAFNKKISAQSVVLMHTKIPCFWNLELGPNSIINQYCHLDCRQHKIRIKNNVDIGPYTRIWTLGHDPDDNSHDLYGGEVVINNHVWIASGVTILPNVFIDSGAVIAAAAVVHKNIERMHIVAGNPAKFIRVRNNELNYNVVYKPLLE